MDGLEIGDQQRARLALVGDGTQVTLHGSGIDLDPLWRHAGMHRPLFKAVCLTLKRSYVVSCNPAADF